MYNTTDFRKNLKIEIEGHPYIVVEAKHVKPGKGVAFVKTKYRSLLTGAMMEKVFRSGDKVGKPDLQDREMSYLYKDDTHWVFMDNATYEQASLSADQIGDLAKYLKENDNVDILFHNATAISVELPNFVVLKVTMTDPGVKGDTATGGSKPATLETGMTVMVPLYMNEGELLKIDTRTGEFVERVKQ